MAERRGNSRRRAWILAVVLVLAVVLAALLAPHGAAAGSPKVTVGDATEHHTAVCTPQDRVTVTLPGTVNPEGRATLYHFEYGWSRAYGRRTPVAHVHLAAGATSAIVRARTANLSPRGGPGGQVLHYRLLATNARGAVHTGDAAYRLQAFNCPAQIVTVTHTVTVPSSTSGN